MLTTCSEADVCPELTFLALFTFYMNTIKNSPWALILVILINTP